MSRPARYEVDCPCGRIIVGFGRGGNEVEAWKNATDKYLAHREKGGGDVLDMKNPNDRSVATTILFDYVASTSFSPNGKNGNNHG